MFIQQIEQDYLIGEGREIDIREEKLKILLEEYKLIAELWKFNRDMGLRRFQINFLINSGLMTLAFTMATQVFATEPTRSFFVVIMMIMGGALSFIWLISCFRHHLYIKLKLLQGVAVERELNTIIKEEKPKDQNIITMFQQSRRIFYKKRHEREDDFINGEEMGTGRLARFAKRYSSSKMSCLISAIFLGLWAFYGIAFLFLLTVPVSVMFISCCFALV